MIAGDQDIGEGLVVAQQHVEARAQPFDQVRFEQQRLSLGRGRHELDRCGRGDHALDARHVPGRPRIGDDALLQVLRLADVEHVTAGTCHAVDARRRRRELGEAQDRVAPAREVLHIRKLDRLLGFGKRLLLVLLLGLRLERRFEISVSD